MRFGTLRWADIYLLTCNKKFCIGNMSSIMASGLNLTECQQLWLPISREDTSQVATACRTLEQLAVARTTRTGHVIVEWRSWLPQKHGPWINPLFPACLFRQNKERIKAAGGACQALKWISHYIMTLPQLLYVLWGCFYPVIFTSFSKFYIIIII